MQPLVVAEFSPVTDIKLRSESVSRRSTGKQDIAIAFGTPFIFGVGCVWAGHFLMEHCFSGRSHGNCIFVYTTRICCRFLFWLSNEYSVFLSVQVVRMSEYSYMTHLNLQAPSDRPDVKLECREAQGASLTKLLQDYHEGLKEKIREGNRSFPSDADNWGDEEKKILACCAPVGSVLLWF